MVVLLFADVDVVVRSSEKYVFLSLTGGEEDMFEGLGVCCPRAYTNILNVASFRVSKH
jgi:hypothetical protein